MIRWFDDKPKNVDELTSGVEYYIRVPELIFVRTGQTIKSDASFWATATSTYEDGYRVFILSESVGILLAGGKVRLKS